MRLPGTPFIAFASGFGTISPASSADRNRAYILAEMAR
jgi:hypothetical protein